MLQVTWKKMTRGLQNCSIVIRGVSRGDESCYKCLFNAFPEGAISGTTCLHVNGKNHITLGWGRGD
uniref:Immunoglobulin V-set domain-containing protein n=1 Tax=Oncorhynchus mykiss TaxID=8022 RepID=A0A8K9V663_ONCMY